MRLFTRFAVCLAAAVIAGALCLSDKAFAAEKKIALMWAGESGMARRVSMGFLPRLREIAPDMKVAVRMDLKDMDEARKLFDQFSNQMDGIVFLRSSGAKFLGTVQPAVPCFVGACNDPVFLGAVDTMDAPDGKVTGVTYYIPYERRFKAIQALFPDIKSVCILLEEGHPGAPIDRRGTKTQCERLGITYNEVAVTDAKELESKVRDIADKVDLFILGSQAVVLDNTPILVEIGNASKTPLFSYSDAPVKQGALVGLAARDKLLGAMLADSVVDVVVKGKPISEVPIKTDPEPTVSLNEEAMEFFDLKVPPSILQNARIIRNR